MVKNVYLNRKSIHKLKNCDNSLSIPTKMHNLLPISLFWSRKLVLLHHWSSSLAIHSWWENHHRECEIRSVRFLCFDHAICSPTTPSAFLLTFHSWVNGRRTTIASCMDGWVRVLRPFNSISVISRRWKGEHEWLCAMKRRLGSGRISPPARFEPATPWSEVGSANRSATRTLHHCKCKIRLVFRFLLQTITATNVKSDFCWQI